MGLAMEPNGTSKCLLLEDPYPGNASRIQLFSTMGLVDDLFQLALFPRIFKKFGPKRIMTVSTMGLWLIFSFLRVCMNCQDVPLGPGMLDSRVWGLLGSLTVASRARCRLKLRMASPTRHIL